MEIALIVTCLVLSSICILLLIFNIAATVFLHERFEDFMKSLRVEKSVVSKKKAPKTEVKKEKVSAKNAVAVNAARDFQKIRSAEITIPVIAADVLVYGPGELGTAYPEETKLYYSPEALKDF